MHKLSPTGNSWETSFYWVCDPQCERPTVEELKLIENRYRLDIIGGVVNEDLSYEYDEFALVLLDRQYYLLETSGCSCPSPTETWRVQHGPTTLQAIRNAITSGDYAGYSLPKRKEAEFLKLIDDEISRVS